MATPYVTRARNVTRACMHFLDVSYHTGAAAEPAQSRNALLLYCSVAGAVDAHNVADARVMNASSAFLSTFVTRRMTRVV